MLGAFYTNYIINIYKIAKKKKKDIYQENKWARSRGKSVALLFGHKIYNPLSVVFYIYKIIYFFYNNIFEELKFDLSMKIKILKLIIIIKDLLIAKLHSIG